LRYEILFKYGGVYIDTDFECIKSIDDLILNVNNFASSEDGVYLTNAIIGAEKNSLYIDRLLRTLPDKLGVNSIPEETGPVFFTKCIVGGGISSDFCIFPRKYFYPYLYSETHRANESFPDAYAIHRWDHSWKGGIFSRIKQKIKKII
jgi:mannosyltransferase OCH1-like enzyme